MSHQETAEQTESSPTLDAEKETSKSLHSRAQLSCCLPHLTQVNIKEGSEMAEPRKDLCENDVSLTDPHKETL
jgi:hypothetical protein